LNAALVLVWAVDWEVRRSYPRKGMDTKKVRGPNLRIVDHVRKSLTLLLVARPRTLPLWVQAQTQIRADIDGEARNDLSGWSDFGSSQLSEFI